MLTVLSVPAFSSTHCRAPVADAEPILTTVLAQRVALPADVKLRHVGRPGVAMDTGVAVMGPGPPSARLTVKICWFVVVRAHLQTGKVGWERLKGNSPQIPSATTLH